MHDDSFQEILGKISSESPVPGGGSVAALSGCMGASLVSMVCNLTIGKKKYREVEQEFSEVLKESENLQKELLELSAKDVEAFNGVMAAFKLPDGEEKKTMLEEAYKNAAAVPSETAASCLRIMELALTAVKSGNINALSDSAVGALMAYSGLNGAILNIRINLKHIEDEHFNNNMELRSDIMEKKAQRLLDEVLEIVRSNFSD